MRRFDDRVSLSFDGSYKTHVTKTMTYGNPEIAIVVKGA